MTPRSPEAHALDAGHGSNPARRAVVVLDDQLTDRGHLALISGVPPRAISGWLLATDADAVDWVTGMVMENLERLDAGRRSVIARQAGATRERWRTTAPAQPSKGKG